MQEFNFMQKFSLKVLKIFLFIEIGVKLDHENWKGVTELNVAFIVSNCFQHFTINCYCIMFAN